VVPVENSIVEVLLARGWKIAVAESLTGGEISARLSSSPGTGDSVLGGVVSYATETKRRLLSVEGPVVSAAAARQMASGVRVLMGADIGLSVTGVAGPARQEDQPVGTVFVGWSTPIGDGCRQLACAGAPEQIRRQTADAALQALLEVVSADGDAADGP
jgi:PncC family amidohydrolase